MLRKNNRRIAACRKNEQFNAENEDWQQYIETLGQCFFTYKITENK